MQATELQALVQTYLDAFEARDLPQCMGFYANDATLTFQSSLYRGKADIETWHQNRFTADLRLIRLDGIQVHGDTATAHGVVTSNRLKAWKIPQVSGAVTFLFRDGKIKEVKFHAQLSPWG